MKKKILIVFTILIAVTALVFFVGSGFIKRNDVFLNDYTVSEDSSKITINVSVASSMGYVRDCNIRWGGNNKYIDFYQCFGGLNSNIAAKNTFDIETPPECEEIYFSNGDGGYKLVLQRNIAGEWERV